MATAPASVVAVPDWRKMKVPELREELANRGMDASGVKAALIDRLEGLPRAGDDGKVAPMDDERKDVEISIDGNKKKLASAHPIETETASVGANIETDVPKVVESVQSAGQVVGSAAPSDSPAEVVKVDPLAPSTDLEKKQRRAERFGLELMVSEVEKRRLRAARFGDTKTNGNANSNALIREDVSKMSPTLKDAEAVKRKARAARFGIEEVSDKLAPSGEDIAKKKARLARFGLEVKIDSAEQEKKKLRAARFGLISESKPQSEPEMPVAVEQQAAT